MRVNSGANQRLISVADNMPSQAQPHWLGSSSPADCAVSSEMLNEQEELIIDEGTINASASYSQGYAPNYSLITIFMLLLDFSLNYTSIYKLLFWKDACVCSFHLCAFLLSLFGCSFRTPSPISFLSMDFSVCFISFNRLFCLLLEL